MLKFSYPLKICKHCKQHFSAPNVRKHERICKIYIFYQQLILILTILILQVFQLLPIIEKENMPSFDDLESIQEQDDDEEMNNHERGLIISYNNSEPKLPTAETECGRNIGATISTFTISANISHIGVKEVIIGNELNYLSK
jgi:hypothetical protein